MGVRLGPHTPEPPLRCLYLRVDSLVKRYLKMLGY